MPRRRSISLLFVVFLGFVSPGIAEETPPPEKPQIAPASDEAQSAMSGFTKPEGWTVALFAAEPDVANPVALHVDNEGRIYVCETFRQGQGVEDNRGHGEWLDEDLAAQTVEDRLAYIRRHLGEEAVRYTRHDDRIRLLADTDGDGRADRSTVFADRFNGILEGTGAGVLAHNGNVYYTCIPNLWLLRDEDGDGESDSRRSLHYGFGVRFAFRGHDLHGLIVGPDGRLYFSVGDRGYHIEQGERTLANPESGAVFRCELDGSRLEAIHTGLRNPQELAFDEFGNLFTGDNNSDSGDKARWVYVVQGGDSGWRMAYQYLGDRGPFNREKIWHPFHENQPAYIVPPVTNIADGPSGLAYYPGTGLSDDYRGKFFLCDFRGGPANSGIRSFRVQPQGAFFELTDAEQPLWNILATDVQFGPGGGVYVSDWVDGWNGLGKGRIYRFADAAKSDDPLIRETRELLAADLSEKKSERLAELLAHPDMRVRQQAQFALAERDPGPLAEVARSRDSQLARLHAIWGLGQVARRGGPAAEVAAAIGALLDDEDAEVRAQAAKVCGEIGATKAADKLLGLLSDPQPRVRYFAAQSAGSLAGPVAIEPLLDMLSENEGRDPMLRHGGVMGLFEASRPDGAERLASAAKGRGPAARMGVLLALRRLKSPLAATFLDDPDESLVAEAARAIYDLPIPAALPALAAAVERSTENDSILRRALAANYRLGTEEHARRAAALAAGETAPTEMRLFALKLLENWAKPSPRDVVLGMWRPLEERDAKIASSAVRVSLPGLAASPGPVRREAARIAARLGIREIGPVLLQQFDDEKSDAPARAEALLALAALKDERLAEALSRAEKDDQPQVRAAALTVLAQSDPAAALPRLEAAIADGETIERQTALSLLGASPQPGASAIVERALDRLIAGEIPEDTQLDVLEAARLRKTASIAAKVERYEASRPADDPAARLREARHGGDALRGERIFFEKGEVSCVRCHKIDGRGGDVGPDLSKIAADKDRQYLLEAVVHPNKVIAKGFESVVVATDDGQILAGVVKKEDDQLLRIVTAEGRLIDIPRESIEARKAGQSPMPEDLMKHLTPMELRDLIEYLATLRGESNDE